MAKVKSAFTASSKKCSPLSGHNPVGISILITFPDYL